jgi:Protein kinase domain
VTEEVLNLQPSKKKIVRYPFFLNQVESPHRLYPALESVGQAMSVLVVMFVIELALCVLPCTGIFHFGLMFLIPLVAIFFRLLLRNTHLNVSDQGISFPLLMTISLKGRLNRSWSDIETLDLHLDADKGNFVAGNVLTITFKSGGRADLNTTRIPRADLCCLQEKVAECVDNNILTPAFSELVSRNDSELSDSVMFVFSTRHRNLLSTEFGLTSYHTYQKGADLFDGPYIVEKCLAAGGNRASYLVTDTNAACNLRLVEFDLSLLDASIRDSCIAELSSLCERYRHLQVTHLLNLINYRNTKEKFILLMESCEEQTLRSFVKKRGKLTENAVCSMSLKLAEAVEKMNGLEVPLSVGGIRPDAIVYKQDGTIWVTEMGFVDDLIMDYSHLLLIDAPYAAPERIAGKSVPASDLYSIGATMYFALTGREPECYTGGSVSAANSKVSPAISNLVTRLLSLDPLQRGSAAELVSDLGGLSANRIETHCVY